MAGKDAQPRTWRQRLATVGFVVVVLGTCIAIRCFDSAPSANAQSPAKTARSKKPTGRQTQIANARSEALRAAASTQNSSQDIVALVNGQKITRDRLRKECLRRFGERVPTKKKVTSDARFVGSRLAPRFLVNSPWKADPDASRKETGR